MSKIRRFIFAIRSLTNDILKTSTQNLFKVKLIDHNISKENQIVFVFDYEHMICTTCGRSESCL